METALLILSLYTRNFSTYKIESGLKSLENVAISIPLSNYGLQYDNEKYSFPKHKYTQTGCVSQSVRLGCTAK